MIYLQRCGRLDDQIALLKHKLHLINQGMAFNGKRTKTARSLGKKFQVSIEQEATRLLVSHNSSGTLLVKKLQADPEVVRNWLCNIFGWNVNAVGPFVCR